MSKYTQYGYYTKPEDIAALLANNPVTNVVQENEYSLLISFESTDTKLQLIASADCCGESYFELLPNSPLENIIGKVIERIYDSDQVITLPPSGKQECDDNKMIVIEFDDETGFFFLLRNSSNGYYPGFLTITLVES